MDYRFILLSLFFFCSFSLTSQSISYNYEEENIIRLEFNRPIFKEGIDANFLTFDSFLNGEFKVGNNNKISFEIPFTTFSFDFGIASEKDSKFGNVAIGYQFRKAGQPNYFDLKLRLPTTDENSFIFIFTDYTERLSAIIPNILSVEGLYNIESQNTTGSYYRFRPGISFWYPTGDDSFSDDFEMLLNLNFLGGFRGDKFDLNAGLITSSILTEKDIELDERVFRQLISTFTFTANNFKPGIIVRVPLGDDFNDSYGFSLGIQMTYIFGDNSKNPIETN